MFFEIWHSEVSMNATEMCLHKDMQHVDWTRSGNTQLPCDWQGSSTRQNLLGVIAQ